MESSLCFMCGEKAESVHLISESEGELEPSISNIICQHFWFQEYVLQTAIICESCWRTVYQFHRYYEHVKQYHEQLSETNTISIKQEEIEIEEEDIVKEDWEMEVEGSLNVKSGIEFAEDRNQLLMEANPVGKQDQLESIVKVEQSKLETQVSFGEESEIEIAEESTQPTKEADQAIEKQTRNKEYFVQKRQLEDGFIKQHFPYNCGECTVKFESFLSMRSHMIDVHSQAYIMCCGVQYTNRSLLYQHVQAVLNPEAFKCELCDKSYTLHIGYIRHKQRHHPSDDPFRCDQCPRRFPSQDLLIRHIANHERYKKKKYKCEICGKNFGRKHSLQEHITAVHEKKAYVCEICSKSFSSMILFKEHRMTHDYTADELKRQCPICKRWQKNVRLWRNHIERHKGDGVHKCDQCDHVSPNVNALKRHIERMHERKVDCPCDVCGKVYSNPYTLREHVANFHTKEPLYQCRFCEEKFFTSTRMYKHRKRAHPKEWKEYIQTKFGIDEGEEQKGENSE